MKWWNLYFIVKLTLYSTGHIDFKVAENLCFALLLVISIHYAWFGRWHAVLAIPAAIALLYHDSWLPGPTHLFEGGDRVLGFSTPYLLELAGRLLNWPLLFGLLLLAVLYHVLSRHLPLTRLTLAALLIPLLPFSELRASIDPDHQYSPLASKTELDQALADFYREQSTRVVQYAKAKSGTVPFDIVFLHVCSMSWDDLKAVGEAENAFFNRFDVVFTQFNAATAYSGPAMIRFQHGSCGHEPHDEMYDPAAPDCHTLNALHQIGYQPTVALNHNGVEGDFLGELREIGAVNVAPMAVDHLTPRLYSYDNSPVYSDYDVLAQWWRQRLQNPQVPSVLYYNTVTMHDGARSTKAASDDSLVAYRPRARQLFADIDRFISQLQASGRRAVVVFIPEHGTNLRGDKMQIPGMREIPSPSISTVPVGVKLIGLKNQATASTRYTIDEPVSYFAVSTLLSRLIETDPFSAKDFSLAGYTANLPRTMFVSENNRDTLIMRYQGQYYLQQARQHWSPYTP